MHPVELITRNRTKEEIIIKLSRPNNNIITVYVKYNYVHVHVSSVLAIYLYLVITD